MVTLLQGDCIHLLRDLPTESVDAIITDPPYSSGGAMREDRVQNTGSKYVMTGTEIERPDFQGDTRDQRAYALWCMLWLSECFRVLKTGAPICLFTDWRQLPVTTDVMQIGGFVWRGLVPWNKTEAARPTRGRFRVQCEYVVWGSKGPMWEHTQECLPGFFTYVVKQAEKKHQAGKPIGLMVDMLKVSRVGGVVLDPFMGSGTTGIAAVRTGRDFVGMELEPAYYEEARSGIEAEQNQPALVLA